MKVIVGLGNPGAKYDQTFHNVGFSALDRLADRLSITPWSERFKGLQVQGRLQGNPYLLLKPQTFMNISGESVVPCLSFFKCELRDLLVLSDDLDLPIGALRYREKGGHGGHNGLRSIIQLAGGNEFHRIKIGIGRPTGKMSVSSYVLSRPSVDDQVLLDQALDTVVDVLQDFLSGKRIQITP